MITSISRFFFQVSIQVIFAPAIVLQRGHNVADDLIAGHTMEVNAQTDIVITASLGQLQLCSLLVQEVLAAQQVLSFKPGFGRHGKFKNSKRQISHLSRSYIVFLSNYNALLHTRVVFTSFLDFFSSRAFSSKIGLQKTFGAQNNSSKHRASKRPLISIFFQLDQHLLTAVSTAVVVTRVPRPVAKACIATIKGQRRFRRHRR